MSCRCWLAAEQLLWPARCHAAGAPHTAETHSRRATSHPPAAAWQARTKAACGGCMWSCQSPTPTSRRPLDLSTRFTTQTSTRCVGGRCACRCCCWVCMPLQPLPALHECAKCLPAPALAAYMPGPHATLPLLCSARVACAWGASLLDPVLNRLSPCTSPNVQGAGSVCSGRFCIPAPAPQQVRSVHSCCRARAACAWT